MNDFKHLLEPRSIAVVGVSDDMGRPGSQAVRALVANGYAGTIYPVNPKYQHFEGLKCYGSVAEIEGEVDLVVVGVPAQGVLPVLEASAKKRVPFALIFSGGFREAGPEGVERERQMLELARASGMRILGPNCLGFANIHANVYAAFGSISRPPKLKPGAVSLVTQSGGFGYSIALACAEAGIGFRHVIATGNESDIDTVQVIDALLDDEETRFIVSYIEGTSDGRTLFDVGRKALAAGKPVLLWKGGATKQGARAAESHTASMTSSYEFYQALFKQTGIIEIQELHQAVDYLKALAPGLYPKGRGVAVMGVSGGSAIVFADAGERAGLRLCDLDPQTQQNLAQVVPSIGAIANPIDLTAGYFSAANAGKVEIAVRATLDDPNADALCVNLATTGQAGSKVAAQVLQRVALQAGKPIVVFSSAPVSEIGAALEIFTEARIPVFPSPSRAAQAIAMLANYHEAQQRLAARLPDTGARAAGTPDDDLRRIAQAGRAFSEAESKAILQKAGLSITKDVIVQDPAELKFDSLFPPLVVKIVSRDIPHKTEIGGVKVGIYTEAELRDAVREVLANAREHAPDAHVEGVLVSEMVRGGFELIAGVVNDEVFGPLVVVGAGGIYTEILRDSSCRLAPFGEETAHEMLAELRCRPILDGARGSPALDAGAVAKTLAALSRLAWDNRDHIQEIDVNPLFVLPGRAVVADALIIPRKPARAPA